MFACKIFQNRVFALILFYFACDHNFLTITAQNITPPTLRNPQQEVEVYEITEIDVNIILYDKRILQLEVRWIDNLPNNTSYNVIVRAMYPNQCPEVPCSMYGVPKLKMDQFLLLPEDPMAVVDVMECSFMFDCSYKLIVETSNASVSKSTVVNIPNCVSEVCSCKHAPSMPKVQMNAVIPQNDTINFNWSIKLFESESIGLFRKQQADDKLNALRFYKLYLKVSEETNPSLSWGGKLLPVAENVYSLRDMSYISEYHKLQGKVKIKTDYELETNATINLQSFLEDDFGCSGPSNLVKIKVPIFTDPRTEVQDPKYKSLHPEWIIGSTLSLSVGIFILIFLVWYKRRTNHSFNGRRKDEHCMTPIAIDLDMVDNINYIDKYVEEAQARGLADIFEVPHHAVHLEEEVGEGAFGRVYKAVAVNLRRMRGASVVAVKQLKRNPTAAEVAEFLTEIEMLKGVGTHINIVCFLGCCTIRSPYLMIMEYVGRGDLLTYLRNVRQYAWKMNPEDANYTPCKPQSDTSTELVNYIELKPTTQSTQSVGSGADLQRQKKPSTTETTYTNIEMGPKFEYILDHKELHNFALQIANGMRFLEAQDITHRDLAARNVLIDDGKTLKISDFGLSRHGVYTNTKTRKLPLRWLSIEAIRDNIYSSKSDVWAYGVVLWEIGTLGASPYPAISNHELVPYLLEGKRLEKPEICTQQVYDIMLQCWHENPEKRPTFEGLFKELSPRTSYVDINDLSDDYVFPPINIKEGTNS